MKVDKLGELSDIFTKGQRFHDVGTFFIMGAHNSGAGRRFYTVEKIAGGGLLIAKCRPWSAFSPGISRRGGGGRRLRGRSYHTGPAWSLLA